MSPKSYRDTVLLLLSEHLAKYYNMVDLILLQKEDIHQLLHVAQSCIKYC